MADITAYDRGLVVVTTGAGVPLLFHDNGDGTFSPVLWTGGGTTTLTNLEKSEDAAHASGDKGVMALAVRKDTAAALAGTDGDYIPLIVDASGRLHIAPLPAGTNNIGDVDVLTQPGAPNVATGQYTATSSSAEAVATRATRRSVLIRNTDATNSAYVGASGVSAANGFLLKAGEAVAIDSKAAIHAVRATADVVLGYIESFD